MYPQVASEDSKPAAYYHPPAAATGLPVSHGSAAPYSTGLPVSHSSTTAYSTASSDYHAPLPPPRPKPVDWSTGLCDCFSDTKNCCITCWCPCITFGQVAEIVDKGSTSCGASGALYTLICCVIGCGCLYSCFYRSKMRQQQNLKGNNCLDCLIHCCCEPCALCQEYRQLENQGFDMVIGWHGNVEQRSRGIAMSTSTAPPPAEQGMSR